MCLLVSVGLTAALYAGWGHYLPALRPVADPLGAFWPSVAGFCGTLFVGAILSLVPSRRKTDTELEGLVVGLGRLGILPELAAEAENDVIWLDTG